MAMTKDEKEEKKYLEEIRGAIEWVQLLLKRAYEDAGNRIQEIKINSKFRS